MPLVQSAMHVSGPLAPRNKYFVYTGNTVYGIQNLEYDEYSGDYFAFVYRGEKPQFPNYNFFRIDGKRQAVEKTLSGMNVKGQVLSLKNVDEQAGCIGGNDHFDEKESCCGNTACEVGNVKGGGGYFPFGSMGVHSLGNGVFYFVEPDNSDLKNLSVNSVAYRLTEIDGTTRFVRFDEKA